MSDPRHEVRSYLMSGGLFNPELATHDKVRDLIMSLDQHIAKLEKENKKAFKAGYEAGMLIMESPQGWGTWQQAYKLWKKHGKVISAFSG